jgi:hypothetical protein
MLTIRQTYKRIPKKSELLFVYNALVSRGEVEPHEPLQVCWASLPVIPNSPHTFLCRVVNLSVSAEAPARPCPPFATFRRMQRYQCTSGLS